MISYQPNQRYAFLAKTRAGKTVWMTIMVARLVPAQPWLSDWRVWWIDTKHDPADLIRLREWGFRYANEPGRTARRIISVRGTKDAVYEQCQLICQRALELRGILLVFDEYGHACRNRVDAGPYLEDVHKQGGGLDVGLAGGVQEPAFVPRQLFSQASYLFLGNLTHLRDIKIARELNPWYAPGWPEIEDTVPDAHGFWAKYLDGHGGDGKWIYWHHVAEWDARLNAQVPVIA